MGSCSRNAHMPGLPAFSVLFSSVCDRAQLFEISISKSSSPCVSFFPILLSVLQSGISRFAFLVNPSILKSIVACWWNSTVRAASIGTGVLYSRSNGIEARNLLFTPGPSPGAIQMSHCQWDQCRQMVSKLRLEHWTDWRSCSWKKMCVYFTSIIGSSVLDVSQ